MSVRNRILACSLAATVMLVPLAGCSLQAKEASVQNEAASAPGTETASGTSATATMDPGTPVGDEQYILYLGTNDKDTNQPVFTPEEAKEHAKAILMRRLGGYTIQEAEGGWKGDDGTEYQEYTLVIHLSDTNIDTVHAVAQELIEEFHQSSVLINTELVQTEFYEGE